MAIDMKTRKLLESAFELASKKYIPFQEPNYTTYSSIYIGPTSNTKDAIKLYNNYTNVMASTLWFGLEAALGGAKRVDLFDINELQILYGKYILAAIKVLKYEDFIKYFTLPEMKYKYNIKNDFNNILASQLFDDLSKARVLSSDVELFFGNLYNWYSNYELILSALFRFEHPISLDYLKRFSSFYNEEEYYKLQKILRSDKCQLTYNQVSLVDVPDKFSLEYNLIILDNILQYYKKNPGLNTVQLVDQFIKQGLSRLVSLDGTIQVNYGFQVAADLFGEYFDIPEKKTLDIFKKLELESLFAKKEDINVLLYEGYSDYTYDIIPGVEGYAANNLVINYKKRIKKVEKGLDKYLQ